MSYDFVARWADARVSRRGAGGAVVDCPLAGDRIQCPDITFNFVRRQIVEVDTRLRLGAAGAAGGAGHRRHRVPGRAPRARAWWSRPACTTSGCARRRQGTVDLRVVVDGVADATFTTGNDDGWALHRIDTSARAGQVAAVRFEITSPAPYARHFALAAEARE